MSLLVEQGFFFDEVDVGRFFGRYLGSLGGFRVLIGARVVFCRAQILFLQLHPLPRLAFQRFPHLVVSLEVHRGAQEFFLSHGHLSLAQPLCNI